MRISAKAEYALLAMMELVQAYGSRAVVSVEEIARKQHIPQKYLVHILIQLKKNGLIESRRGFKGGYVLARDPSAIALGSVIPAMEGPILALRTPSESGRPRGEGASFTFFWEQFRSQIEAVLDRISMKDIHEQITHRQSPMYYI